MKLILRGLAVAACIIFLLPDLKAQSKSEFLDPQFNIVADSMSAKFIRTIKINSDSSRTVQVNYMTGNLMMTGGYLDKDLTLEHGDFKYFFANGNLESEGAFKKGAKIGNWKRYNFDGRPKPDRFYPDESKSGVKRPTSGAKFPGGMAALQKFVNDSLRYPEEARDRKIEGVVYVTFIIDATGDVRQAEVSEGVHYLLDDEALRFVSTMPEWSPAVRNGVAVDSSFIMPITFKVKNSASTSHEGVPGSFNQN